MTSQWLRMMVAIGSRAAASCPRLRVAGAWIGAGGTAKSTRSRGSCRSRSPPGTANGRADRGSHRHAPRLGAGDRGVEASWPGCQGPSRHGRPSSSRAIRWSSLTPSTPSWVYEQAESKYLGELVKMGITKRASRGIRPEVRDQRGTAERPGRPTWRSPRSPTVVQKQIATGKGPAESGPPACLDETGRRHSARARGR